MTQIRLHQTALCLIALSFGCTPAAEFGIGEASDALTAPVSRDTWINGNSETQCEAIDKVPRYRITVHHTDQHDVTDGESSARSILAYHRSRVANEYEESWWCDVGYHFLIAPSGTIYEGRPIEYIGSHTAYQNDGNIGIALMGNYEQEEPSLAMKSALKDLLGYITTTLGFDIDLEGRHAHCANPDDENESEDGGFCLRGHGETKNNVTTCPGKYVFPVLNEIRGASDPEFRYRPQHDPSALQPTAEGLSRVIDQSASPEEQQAHAEYYEERTCTLTDKDGNASIHGFDEDAWRAMGGQCYSAADTTPPCADGSSDYTWKCAYHNTYGLVAGLCIGGRFAAYSTEKLPTSQCFACNNPDYVEGQGEPTYSGSSYSGNCLYIADN
ncbi:MAG: N-acetylmuramoyl-L-alanine amidase [Myxococcales bacterium]|nr:MAG: N-acetylmuramoyl-L-alanine amidase [Myxococcales bacterium]